MTVTHSDGFPVPPVTTDAAMIGMGERYDVTVTLKDGVFPLVLPPPRARTGRASGSSGPDQGTRPQPTSTPLGWTARVLLGTDLTVVEEVALADRSVDREHDVTLGGSMARYRLTIDGKMFPDTDPLTVKQAEQVRLHFQNRSMMFHPMHLHGHTFGLHDGGTRMDTVIVRAM